MTKKEKERLHDDKCKIEIVDHGKTDHRYIVSFSLNAEEVVELKKVLEGAGLHPIHITNELHNLEMYLNNAFTRASMKL